MRWVLLMLSAERTGHAARLSQEAGQVGSGRSHLLSRQSQAVGWDPRRKKKERNPSLPPFFSLFRFSFQNFSSCCIKVRVALASENRNSQFCQAVKVKFGGFLGGLRLRRSLKRLTGLKCLYSNQS